MKVKCKHCGSANVERFGIQETDKMKLITYWCHNCRKPFYIKTLKTN